MLLVAMNILINGFLLTWVYVMTFALMHMGEKVGAHHIHDWVWYVSGYGSILFLSGLAYLPMAQWLLRLFLNVRRATKRECAQIEPLLATVLNKLNETSNNTYNTSQYSLMVSNTKAANAQAFGHNTIIITRGLLTGASEEELQAVLAHELGHLEARDSIVLLAIVFGSFGMKLVLWLYALYQMITNFIGMLGEKGNAVITIARVLPALVFLPIIILNWLGNRVFMLGLGFWSRGCEYRADKFAADLGYRDGLISYLEKVEALTESDSSLLGMIFASHPDPMQRIDRLEK